MVGFVSIGISAFMRTDISENENIWLHATRGAFGASCCNSSQQSEEWLSAVSGQLSESRSRQYLRQFSVRFFVCSSVAIRRVLLRVKR